MDGICTETIRFGRLFIMYLLLHNSLIRVKSSKDSILNGFINFLVDFCLVEVLFRIRWENRYTVSSVKSFNSFTRTLVLVRGSRAFYFIICVVERNAWEENIPNYSYTKYQKEKDTHYHCQASLPRPQSEVFEHHQTKSQS